MKRIVFLFAPLFCWLLIPSLAQSWEENFDKGKAEGWKVITGTWSVKDKEYVCAQGGANEFTFFEESIDNTKWVDYTFEVKVKPISATNYAGVHFRVQATGIGTPAWASGKFYYWLIGITPNGAVGYSKVWKGLGGPEAVLDVAKDTLKQGEWNDIKVIVTGDNIKLYLRGALQKEFTQKDFPAPKYDYGGIGLAVYAAEAHFDNVKVMGPGIPGAAVDSAGKLTTSWGHLKAAE